MNNYCAPSDQGTVFVMSTVPASGSTALRGPGVAALALGSLLFLGALSC